MGSPLAGAGLLSVLRSMGGVQGTYTPVVGAASTKWGDVRRDAAAVGETTEEATVIDFLRSELDPPVVDSTWSDGTTTWLIGAVLKRDDDMVTVAARRET